MEQRISDERLEHDLKIWQTTNLARDCDRIQYALDLRSARQRIAELAGELKQVHGAYATYYMAWHDLAYPKSPQPTQPPALSPPKSPEGVRLAEQPSHNCVAGSIWIPTGGGRWEACPICTPAPAPVGLTREEQREAIALLHREAKYSVYSDCRIATLLSRPAVQALLKERE